MTRDGRQLSSSLVLSSKAGVARLGPSGYGESWQVRRGVVGPVLVR